MPPTPSVSLATLYTVLSLAAALLAAGLWLGQLEGRVTAIERQDLYLHGTMTVPK